MNVCCGVLRVLMRVKWFVRRRDLDMEKGINIDADTDIYIDSTGADTGAEA